jgi:hypothetical protein
MRGHVLITDKETHNTVVENGFWAIKIPNKWGYKPKTYKDLLRYQKENPKKPVIGMIADILGTRLGDTVFLYERQVGFHGIYKVRSAPFFDISSFGKIGAQFPIRIEIECVNFFQKPVSEDLLFSTKEYESKFWGWFYRKIQGARGANTINPEATQALIELLVKLNGNEISKPKNLEPYKSSNKTKIYLPMKNNSPVDIEDILRAWIIQCLGKSKELEKIFGLNKDLEWFANNVPYHVTRKNIDILVYHKNMRYTGFPLRFQFSVVELKKDEAKPKDVSQVINYSKWVAGRLANSEIETIQPILIAYKFNKETIKKAKLSEFSNREILLYEYGIENNSVKFKMVKI